jgi:hypothetical protein
MFCLHLSASSQGSPYSSLPLFERSTVRTVRVWPRKASQNELTGCLPLDSLTLPETCILSGDLLYNLKLSTIKPIQAEALAWVARFFEGVGLDCWV